MKSNKPKVYNQIVMNLKFEPRSPNFIVTKPQLIFYMFWKIILDFYECVEKQIWQKIWHNIKNTVWKKYWRWWEAFWTSDWTHFLCPLNHLQVKSCDCPWLSFLTVHFKVMKWRHLYPFLLCSQLSFLIISNFKVVETFTSLSLSKTRR